MNIKKEKPKEDVQIQETPQQDVTTRKPRKPSRSRQPKELPPEQQKERTRRDFLKYVGGAFAGAAAGAAGINFLMSDACRREPVPEKPIKAYEIPFDNWLNVEKAMTDDVYMSRCGNFDEGAALLYLVDDEDFSHPAVLYDKEERNRLIEREEMVGIHREKPQKTKDGKRAYTVRVVGLSGGMSEKYAELEGKQVRVSLEKAKRYSARPTVDIEDLGPGLHRDTVITAYKDVIDVRNLK